MPRRGLQLPLKRVQVWFRDGSTSFVDVLLPGQANRDIVLTREPSVHKAWTGKRVVLEEEGERSAFAQRYGKGLFAGLSREVGATDDKAAKRD